MKTRIVTLFIASSFLIPTLSYSTSNLAGWYVAAKGGLFQGMFDQKYLDQTDTVTQNIETNTQQNGYTGGIAVGYQKAFPNNYSLGGELTANLNSQHSTFQSGASTSAFSDSINIGSHVDLLFVPSLLLTESISAYLKLGLSYALLSDYLSSPVGPAATMTRYSSNKSALGGAAGIGVSKFITPQISLFVEGMYHDYGVLNFSSFQNFSANYTHTARVTSSSFEIGAAYHF